MPRRSSTSQVVVDDTSQTRRIYDDLRRSIITGVYREGEKLPEARLAEMLGVSRLPVREALTRLEFDWIVSASPRRSAIVRCWDRTAVEDLFDVRIGLEPVAARLAAARIRQGADCAPLLAALQDSHSATASSDPLRRAEASANLHGAIVDLAGNALLAQLMRAILARMAWLFYLIPPRDSAQRTRLDDHMDLIAAITSGDERLAEYAMLSHTEAGRIPTLAILGELRH
ncbi:FCD domain-containing protein [Nocardia sp. SYP-A9097]|uniref:GntR family transcriptional regulator n=1 Tax=Nocardia sp. SYP-A9097 TaxID=2663237 RepID=UPI00129AB923|nr:GntR family transcriptional regulator [Nocardia sp. SYP-A9097]MRH91824.1 FCD domain-containing protein [Nocardia sp. SYP-A9097]